MSGDGGASADALSGSYRPEETEGGIATELARLQSQLELSWIEEQRLLVGLGLTDGMSVVELGSGPGLVTEKLLSLLPSSRICAVEIRPDLHAEAERRFAGVGGGRLSLLRASALDTGMPPEGFHLALARYLFQHLEDPVAAAREAYRLLRPGGRLVVIDVDAALWGLADPYVPALQSIYAKAESLQMRRGGNRLMGRRLTRILAAAGFAEPRLETFVYHSDAIGLEPFRAQMSPERLLPALRAGLISQAEYDLAAAESELFLSDPSSFVLMLGFLAHGVRSQLN